MALIPVDSLQLDFRQPEVFLLCFHGLCFCAEQGLKELVLFEVVYILARGDRNEQIHIHPLHVDTVRYRNNVVFEWLFAGSG